MIKDEKKNKQLEKLGKSDIYKIENITNIEEIDSVAVTMLHKKTKAKILLMLNDDDNKVFTVGFRTPSINSTGVAHILEHSVLCGSRKFPSKDPFVELVKGSLNTFLNAMTYPDKTVYPVASVNDKDFHNLCDVYLDSVFYPNVYKEDKIFKQEGWHYELDKKDGELKINGIVYNEMKGVFSSVDGMLDRLISKSLFEGHSYGEESGGDPDFIPELSYEEFINYHASYYHPSNSYIYFYGNMDMAKKLEWLDREYLSDFEYREVDSAIKDVIPWKESKELKFEYPISDEESEEDASYISLNTLVGGEFDPVVYTAFEILDYALLQVPGAVLKEALIDAGIGKEILGGYSPGIKEPYFSVIAKQTSNEKLAEFKMVVKGTLRKLLSTGLDKEVLKAAINVYEFKAREADFGSYPKGLVYGLQAFDSWLYDADPTSHLRFQHIFDTLKSRLEDGFFEDLIREYLLGNPHEVYVTLVPKKGLAAEKEAKLKSKLEAYKKSLSEEQIETIIKETDELKAYQEEPSRPEDILKIPLLNRSDIKKEAAGFKYEVKQTDGVKVIHSSISTSDIAYVKSLFDISDLSKEELQYAQLLSDILGMVDTKDYTYSKLSTLINLNTGGVSLSLSNVTDIKTEEDKFYFGLNSKVLYDKLDSLADIWTQLIIFSNLDNKKRIKEVLLELKAGLKTSILSSGHVTSLNRAFSHVFKSSLFTELIKGIEYYRFLERLDAGNDYDTVVHKLESVRDKIFNKNKLILHITGDDKVYSYFSKFTEGFLPNLGDKFFEKNTFEYTPQPVREAFSCASSVNYVSRVGDFKKHGFEYTGVLKIFKVLLSYEYLWNLIRVQGGAYGAMAVFTRYGAGFTSFRDPNISATDKVYQGIADYAASYEADEREMTKSVIGAISTLDTPLSPSQEGSRALLAYLTGYTFEDVQRERNQILEADAKDIRALAPMLKAVLSENAVCAIVNESQLKTEDISFDKVELLYSTGEV